MTHLRGKRHRAPRLRATEHLADIVKVAQMAKEFLQGHRMKPAFRRQASRELRLARAAIRRFYTEATGQQ